MVEDTSADAQVKLNESGAVVVDEAMQTSVDNIYAIGDVIGPTPPLPSSQLHTSPHPCCRSLERAFARSCGAQLGWWRRARLSF